MGKEWIKLKGIGQLYLEQVLVRFNIPVLFVCTDYENRKYLCLNIDDETGKTVIARTDNKSLISMLKNNISMEMLFRNAIDGKLVVSEYDCDKDNIITEYVDANIAPASILPELGAKFELHNKSIEEYVLRLERQIPKLENEKYCEEKKYTVKVYAADCEFFGTFDDFFDSEKMLVEDAGRICVYNLAESNKMIA